MTGLRRHVGWLMRGDAQTRAAFDRLDRLQAEVDELRARLARLEDENAGLRREMHGSVTDITGRLGAMNDRLERSGA